MRTHELSSESEDEQLMNLPSTKALVEQYTRDEQIDADLDPLRWWKLQEDKYSILTQLTKKKKIACTTATVPCERFFFSFFVSRHANKNEHPLNRPRT